MSLFKYVVAAAVGYYLGQPSGRRQIQRLRRQATELLHSPQATQLKERGWDVAGERASDAIKLVRRKRGDASAAAALDASGPASNQLSDAAVGPGAETGFGGRTGMEDTEAVRTEITPSPPDGNSKEER